MNSPEIPIGTTAHINPEEIKWGGASGDLISREALKKDFKARLKNAKNWKENALNKGDDELVIRADATINFICEVLMTINNASTACHDNYSMGYQDGVKRFYLKDQQASG